MNKRNFLLQGGILTAISLVMRSGGMYYRSYLSGYMGAEGLGLYQLIFSVFVLAITLSTSGISLAVTRLVSAAIAKNQRNKIKSIVKKCLLFSLALSLFISCVFFFFSDFLAVLFLSNSEAGESLRILGIGLPFMALCTSMRGYFLSVDESITCMVAEFFEQIFTIGITIAIFTVMPFESIEQACVYAMIASTIGEMISFLIDIIACKFSLKKHTPKDKKEAKHVFKALGHIALPCTMSTAVRSLLNTCENILIPNRLRAGGASYSLSMEQYGLIHGMAVPMLYFPTAIIYSFAFLLIPKICKEFEKGHKKAVAYITGKAVMTATNFGIISFVFFFNFSNLLSKVVYSNEEAGALIKILSPLLPLICLDIVIDCLLKGLDQQIHTMKLNIVDSGLRVLFIWLFLSSFGIDSYVVIIFFSTVFNASLSMHKLIHVTNMSLSIFKDTIIRLPIAFVSVYIASTVNVTENETARLIISLAVSYGIYYAVDFVIKRFRKV